MRAVLREFSTFNRRTRALFLGTGVLSALVLSTSVTGLLLGPSEARIGVLILAAIIYIASSRPIRFPGAESSVSVSETFVFTSAMLFGPPAAAVLAAFDGFISSRKLTAKTSSVVYSVAILSVSAALGALVYRLALLLFGYEVPLGRMPDQQIPLLHLAPAVLALALTHYLVNVGLLTLMIWAKYGKNPLQVWVADYLWAVTTFLAGGTAAAVTYAVVQSFGYVWLLVAIGMALPIPILIHYAFKTYRQTFDARSRHLQELNTIYRSTLETRAMAIEARGQMASGHLQRVQILSKRLGELLGMSEDERRALDAAALLHDIGKLGLPEALLNNPERLSEHEKLRVRSHPVIASDILRNVAYPFPVVEYVRHYHERWDGKGHPDGLARDRIPLGARILAVVDYYDSVLAERPTRDRQTREEVLDLVVQQREGAFDPRVVDVFVSQVDRIEDEIAATSLQQPDFSSLRCADREQPSDAPEAPVRTVLERIAELNREIAAVYEISRRLGSVSRLQDLEEVLGEDVRRLVPAATLVVHMLDADTRASRVVIACGDYPDYFRNRTFAPGEGLPGWVLVNATAMLNMSPRLDMAGLGTEASNSFRWASVFPLKPEGQVIGALALYSKSSDRYSDEQICLLEALVEPIGHALNWLQSNARLEERTFTDYLTGSGNLRAFEFQSAREISRARRFDQPLSLLLVSLENAAELASADGRAVVDAALATIPDLLRKHLRDIDFVARYADTVFVVLLPMTGPAQVGGVVARLVRTCARKRLTIDGKQHMLSIGVGHASWPQDGAEIDELISAAEERLKRRQEARLTRRMKVISLTDRLQH